MIDPCGQRLCDCPSEMFAKLAHVLRLCLHVLRLCLQKPAWLVCSFKSSIPHKFGLSSIILGGWLDEQYKQDPPNILFIIVIFIYIHIYLYYYGNTYHIYNIMVTHMCHNIFIQNCDDMDSQRLPASRLVFRSNGCSPFTSVHQRRAVHAGVCIENAGNLSNHIKP